MRLAVLIVFSLSLSGCLEDALKEPVPTVCSILGDSADCTVLGSDDYWEAPVRDLIGYQCVSPEDSAKLRNHHEALHFELDRKKGKRKPKGE